MEAGSLSSLDVPAVVAAHFPCIVLVTGLEGYCEASAVDTHYCQWDTTGAGAGADSTMCSLYCDAYREFVRVVSEEVGSARRTCPLTRGKQHSICIILSGLSADLCGQPRKLPISCTSLFLTRLQLDPASFPPWLTDPNRSPNQRGPLSSISKSKGKGKGNSHISPVHWADIGGLSRVREEVMKTIEIPQAHPALFHISTGTGTGTGTGGSSSGGPPRALSFSRNGILLYGPPG